MSDDQGQAALHLLGRLDHLIRSARIYPDGHSALAPGVEGVLELGAQLVAAGAGQIWVVEERVVVQDRVVRPSSGLRASIRDLGALLRARGVGGVELRAGLDAAALMAVIRLLLSFPGDGGPGPDAFSRELAALGVRAVGLLGPRLAPAHEAQGGEGDPALAALRTWLRGVRAVQAMREQALTPALLLELDRVATALVDLWLVSSRQALALASPRELVPYHLRHPVHVAILSIALGHALGMDAELLRQLAVCALVADVGMGRLPERVDVREEALTETAMMALRTHPNASVRELLSLPGLDLEARRRLVVALEQHLGVDRGGYPTTLRWPELHLFSRVLALADAFDALRSDSGRREGLTVREALRVLKSESGTRYDPILVEILAALRPQIEVASVGA